MGGTEEVLEANLCLNGKFSLELLGVRKTFLKQNEHPYVSQPKGGGVKK